MLETLWQSGGRVTEVLRLRPCDLDAGEPVLHLVNLKQRAQAGAHLPRTPVIVSPDLVAALRALTNDAHLAHIGYFFRSRKSQDQPMSYGHCWRLIRRSAIVAGVHVVGSDGGCGPPQAGTSATGPPSPGRQGVPLSEVQQQLGHTRIDTTTIYTMLAARTRAPGGPRGCGVVLGTTRARRSPQSCLLSSPRWSSTTRARCSCRGAPTTSSGDYPAAP
ncbi:MAG: site-specific integrase [Chloroflexi bacterium]|nr:site-specific integrase [Chloroflexota bacterium]